MRLLDSTSSFDFTPYTLPIYESVLVRLKAADLDQEVKERAISCMGHIVCHLGDHPAGMKLFMKLIHSEFYNLSYF
jgi:cullin-associated NEDD8-dissociated protein 1